MDLMFSKLKKAQKAFLSLMNPLFYFFFRTFFSHFSLLTQFVKAYIADDDKSFYVKESLYPNYRKHQKLFSYHIYNSFK